MNALVFSIEYQEMSSFPHLPFFSLSHFTGFLFLYRVVIAMDYVD